MKGGKGGMKRNTCETNCQKLLIPALQQLVELTVLLNWPVLSKMKNKNYKGKRSPWTGSQKGFDFLDGGIAMQEENV